MYPISCCRCTSWPKQFSIGLGNLAAVLFGGRIAFAVFADFGPKTKLVEGSLELFRQLDEERTHPNGTVQDVGMGPGIVPIVFPESGAPANMENEGALLSAINSHRPSLFQKLGGVLPTA